MDRCSEEEYFHKLENLVIKSVHYLCQIFKKRWKVESGEDWKDEHSFIQNFLSKHCKDLPKNAIPKKILLKSCSSKDWDISFMSLVLLNFGDEKKYKVQNQAVRQLKYLRNELAHHKSKELTQSMFSEKVEVFKDNLQILGVTETEINKLEEESSVISSLEAIEQMKVFVRSAEQLIKTQKFESALKKYSEALTIPGLLPVNLGEIYENRAACYLCMKDPDKKFVDQAILDAEQALKLTESSWNANYLKAQCYRKKNNLSEAIRYYEIALAISPSKKLVKQDLVSCKLLNDAKNDNATLNLDMLPRSLSEQVKHFNNETGNEFSMESIIQANSKYPAFFGDQYYNGFEVAQDYKKAVKYFTIANKQGDAEGCNKLGLCYFYGHGVEQDVGKGLELFKRCAGMNVKQVGRCKPTSLGFNRFVAEAEYFIGKCYDNGIDVDRDIAQAAFWYTKSMKHGHGEGATSMGLLYKNYDNGDSLSKREKMAELCWKQGVIFNCSHSAECLVNYYSLQSAPKKAWTMLNIAREMGSSRFLEMTDEDFNQWLPFTDSNICEFVQEVTTFEKEQNMGSKGMTLQQRYVRMEEYEEPAIAVFNKQDMNSGGQIQQNNIKDIWDVRFKAAIFGSQTASQIVETVDKILKLNQLLEIQNEFAKVDKLELVNLYYESLLLQNHFLSFMTNKDKFRAIVAELFNESSEQSEGDKMKIRLCFVRENLRNSLESRKDSYALGILKEGLRRYPDNYGYYFILIECLKLRRSFNDALRYVNEALEKFPEKVDLLYEKAEILISDERKSCEVISAYESYLSKASRDHRFVPQAYYAISFAHVDDYVNHEQENPKYKNRKKLKLIRKLFQRAKDSEKDQLSCYLPYGLSDVQLLVADFLTKRDKKDKSIRDLNADAVVKTVQEMQHVLEQKVYLQSPVREGLIRQHREKLKEVIELLRKRDLPKEEKFPVKLRQPRAKAMSQLTAITLQEMNPTKDRIYENRILDLTIIEDPNQFYAVVEIIAEDENGDTTRLFLDHPHNKTSLHLFQVGCRVAVINPYMWRFETRGINGIRINEPKCIIHLEKAKEMCRFCGEENVFHKCVKCKWLYCSAECQILDSKLFNHEMICPFVPN